MVDKVSPTAEDLDLPGKCLTNLMILHSYIAGQG